MSETFHRLASTRGAPAFMKPRVKPTRPSPRTSFPSPVRQAERTTNPAESRIDEIAVARKYYQSFPDDVQQLVVFSNRRLVGPGTMAYEQGVKNEVRGLGDGLYDYAAEYGSAGRLESFVMMDNILKYPDDPAQIFLVGVLIDELGVGKRVQVETGEQEI